MCVCVCMCAFPCGLPSAAGGKKETFSKQEREKKEADACETRSQAPKKEATQPERQFLQHKRIKNKNAKLLSSILSLGTAPRTRLLLEKRERFNDDDVEAAVKLCKQGPSSSSSHFCPSIHSAHIKDHSNNAALLLATCSSYSISHFCLHLFFVPLSLLVTQSLDQQQVTPQQKNTTTRAHAHAHTYGHSSSNRTLLLLHHLNNDDLRIINDAQP